MNTSTKENKELSVGIFTKQGELLLIVEDSGPGIADGFKEKIFDSINVCYPQTKEDQFRFVNLGIQNTVFLGNMKFSVPKLKINEQYLIELEENSKNREKVLCLQKLKNH